MVRRLASEKSVSIFCCIHRCAAGRSGVKEDRGMKRSYLFQFAQAAILLLGSTLAWGGDTSMLRPPKGAKVAIVVFEDLECPQCAKAAPLVHDASKKYNIPLIQYDFPLRQHPWSL